MALTPNNQLEAILAGEDIPVSSRSLAFIKQAVQNGGSGETYETVAEIEVGDHGESSDGVPEGCVGYVVADTASAKAIMASAGDNLFFNSAETPLTRIEIESEMMLFGYNFEIDEEMPVVTRKPAYLVATLAEGGTDFVVEIMSTEDLSNTTVKILKKVSGGGDLPENVKPTYEFGVTITTGSDPGTYVATPDSGVTFAAIKAALAETPNVYFIGTLPTGEKLCVIVDHIGSGDSYINASGMFYTGSSFTAYRLRIESDETCYLDMKPLANAT